MPRIKYEHTRLRPDTLTTITKANQIIVEYQAQGLNLTLRQLYYAFVSKNWIPNNDKEYDKLGNAIATGRMMGLIDWEAIIDRTRFIRKNSHWDSPEQIVEACARSYHIDRWARQDVYLEVFIEKDALIGVIEDVCEENDVPYLACRGYSSVSELWQAGHKRMRPLAMDKQIVVLYLGDHDPSGIDMTRDVRVRLETFIGDSLHEIVVDRIALNMDQIEEYDPPPNPTKLSDSRAGEYIKRFGHQCWELDALKPNIIRDLVETEIHKYRDPDKWDDALAEEADGKAKLQKVAERWDKITKKF